MNRGMGAPTCSRYNRVTAARTIGTPRKTSTGVTRFDDAHLRGMAEKHPDQLDRQMLVAFAEDEDDHDWFVRDQIEIDLMDVLKIHEDVVGPVHRCGVVFLGWPPDL